MLNHLWDFFVETAMALAIPMLCAYHLLCADLFLNVSASDATGLEKAGNTLLIPFQYVFAGREATPKENGEWEFAQRFDYKNAFWVRTASSIVALPASLVLGSFIKGLSYSHPKTRLRHASILKAERATQGTPNLDTYRNMGIPLGDTVEWLLSQGHARRPGEEKKLEAAKKCLAAIGEVFEEAHIPWWADCGTLLGAYRYGGVIPWDFDIDISILLPDFENARRALNRLDREKYLVQDWSGRDFPRTFFKVYVKESGEFIDIDCFEIHPEKKEVQCIFSLEKTLFFPEWFKIRERRFTAPVAYEMLFPLKKALFDGVEVFVPNDSKKYLQRVYGEDLAPSKKYDPTTDRYERDLTHPYWQRAYVH